MKVMLLNPPAPKPMIREGRCQSPGSMRQTSIPQLSLACLGRLLRGEGAEVDLLECMALDLGLPDVLARLEGCGLVFMNTTTPTIGYDLAAAAAIKKAAPDCTVGAFGTHVTALHEAVLAREAALDFVIRREPEETGLAVYRALAAGRGLAGIAGITRRAPEDGVVVEEDRPFSAELDRIARPDRSLLPNHRYIHPLSGKPYTIVNVSRGCPGGCSFCVAHLYYGRKVRTRSVESVLHELEHEAGTDHVWMYADDLTADRAFLAALCEGILERGLKLRWWSNTRADVLDPELYRLMARAGCFMLSIGGESGSRDVLKGACKRIDPEDVVRTVSLLRKAGIVSLVYFLIGLPGETRETIEETVAFARKAAPDYVEFYPAVPYPGTRFAEQAVREGLVAVREFERYECGGTAFVVRVPGMAPGELEAVLLRAFRSYYFRPGYLPILARRLRFPREFAKLIRFGLGYFRRFTTS